jgi:hypothetical protein
MGFAENLRLFLKWDAMREKGRKRDGQMGVVAVSKVKWVKKGEKKEEGWKVGLVQTLQRGRKWVEGKIWSQNIKKFFEGRQKNYFGGTIL